MNKDDLDTLIFVSIILFMINTYIYLFYKIEEGFWSRVRKAFKKISVGTKRATNRQKCINRRENARDDMENESKNLQKTTLVKDFLNTTSSSINNNLSQKGEDSISSIEKKNDANMETIVKQYGEDVTSEQILSQIYDTYNNKMDLLQELL
jgi:hypothetical protein